MNLREFVTRLRDHSPRILGAVFCGLSLLALPSCDKKGNSPDWDTPGNSAPSQAISVTSTDSKPLDSKAPETLPVSTVPATAEPAVPASSGETGPGLRFISYNVENWLTMDRYVDNKSLKGAPKPEKEKEAVIKILADNHPDVIGICEIGTAADLAEIQERLKAAGLNLPNSHYTGGSDPTRHLGFLSKFPITSTSKPEVSEYQLAGQTFGINRGILDVSITANGKPYRFLGVHLKSKRESEQGDQEVIRFNEARLLRLHLDSILKKDANARLVVYGDFNDTRATKPIKMITGKYSDPTYLTAIPVRDSNQEAWTHYWTINDIYSRIDFIMVSQAMKPDVDFKASKILDDKEWNTGSDHRPLLGIFR